MSYLIIYNNGDYEYTKCTLSNLRWDDVNVVFNLIYKVHSMDGELWKDTSIKIIQSLT